MDVRRCTSVIASLVVLGAACARSAEPPPSSAGAHFGDLMAEVGRRFERTGRAVIAGRWELAAYDLDEIDEVFTLGVPGAQLPPDVQIDLRSMARSFATTAPADLRKAIAAHDHVAFDAAFARMAAACNGCHQAAGRPFIEVPTTAGSPVPSLDPRPPPAR